MIVVRLLAFGFVYAMLVVASYSQPAGPPTYSEGDEWTLSDKRVVKVVKMDAGMIVMNGVNRNCPTCLYYFDKNLIIQKIEQADGKPAESLNVGLVMSGWKLWDFPLELRKTWSFSGAGIFRGNPNNYSGNFTVEAYEDVKTKAGTFKAFRIRRDWEIQTRDSRMGTPRWTQTLWYAPDAKTTVKFTTTSTNDTDWELVSYSLK